MASYAQGESAALVVTWQAFSGGPAADVDSQTITIAAVSDGALVVDHASSPITHVTTGTYSYIWDIPADQATGDYVVIWDAVLDGNPATSAPEVITVTDLAVESWATASEVLAITGTTVDGPTLAGAQSDIEIFVNRSVNITPSPRDLYWLKRAVAWQAAWLPGQFGTQTRQQVVSVSQDGVSATYGSRGDVVLAPRASRAIRNLSWVGTRSLRIQPRRRDAAAYEAQWSVASYAGPPDFLNEQADDDLPWAHYPAAFTEPGGGAEYQP